MAVQFKTPGTILFSPDGKVAMDPDCCCNRVECPECGGDGNNAPAILYVEPSGIVDSDCDCTPYNSATLTLDQMPYPCYWTAIFSCAGGDDFGIEISIYQDSGHTWLSLNVYIWIQPLTFGSWWLLDMGTDPVDCLSLDVTLGPAQYQYDYEVPDACVWSGASWRVHA